MMIRFVHIPKTAGTTFSALLSIVAHNRNISFVSRQMCYEDLAKQGDYNVVFVRSPFDHVKSQFLECRDDPKWGQRVRAKKFPHTHNESDDYFSWLQHFNRLDRQQLGSAHDFRCQDPRNTMTRHLSCTKPQQSGDGGHPPNHALNQPVDLRRAMHNLRSASLIGVTEFMHQSVCLFNKSFPYIRKNDTIPRISHGVKHSSSRLDSPQYAPLVSALVPHDLALYSYAIRLFMQTLKAHPDCI